LTGNPALLTGGVTTRKARLLELALAVIYLVLIGNFRSLMLKLLKSMLR
jgi:hypothetical protein